MMDYGTELQRHRHEARRLRDQKIVADIVSALSRELQLSPDGVMVCFKETQWENWSFGGGRFLHA